MTFRRVLFGIVFVALVAGAAFLPARVQARTSGNFVYSPVQVKTVYAARYGQGNTGVQLRVATVDNPDTNIVINPFEPGTGQPIPLPSNQNAFKGMWGFLIGTILPVLLGWFIKWFKIPAGWRGKFTILVCLVLAVVVNIPVLTASIHGGFSAFLQAVASFGALNMGTALAMYKLVYKPDWDKVQAKVQA